MEIEPKNLNSYGTTINSFSFFVFAMPQVGILVPNQGWNLHPLQWKPGALATALPRTSLKDPFSEKKKKKKAGGIILIDFKLYYQAVVLKTGFPGGSAVKNPSARQETWRHSFNPWIRKIPWRRKWQPTPVTLPRKSHGWRSLAGHSPWGCKELDTTERLNNKNSTQYRMVLAGGWTQR